MYVCIYTCIIMYNIDLLVKRLYELLFCYCLGDYCVFNGNMLTMPMIK